MRYRILCIGEILFDIYPDSKHLGGAPFNFAFHLQQFGQNTKFVSRVGNDKNGNEILDYLARRQIETSGIQVDLERQTGEVIVELDESASPKFTIVDNVAYDFIEPDEEMLRFLDDGVDLIYIGTLAQRHSVTRKTIDKILGKKQSDTFVFYDVNLRQQFYTKEILENSLNHSDIVKLNEDEFEVIQEIFKLGEGEDDSGFDLMKHFNLRYLCITRGEKGSSLYFGEDKIDSAITDSDEKRIIDTVGAGDGYASVLAYGILYGWHVTDIAHRANRFAVALCSISGAPPEESSFYSTYAPWIVREETHV